MDKKRAFVVTGLYYGLMLSFAYLVLKFLVPVLVPFIIAFCVVWLLRFPSELLARKIGRGNKIILAILLTMFYVLVGFFVLKLSANVAPSIGNFFLQLPSIYTEQILPAMQDVYQELSGIMMEHNPDVVLEMESIFDQILLKIGSVISNSSGSIIKSISSYAAAVPGIVVKIIITIISSYFIAGDYEHIIFFILGLLPEPKRTKFVSLMDQLKIMLGIFIRSYLLLMVITFVELSIGLSLNRIPYAILIALGIAIFDILPILGTGGVLIPWIIIAAVLGNYGMAIGILITYLVITIVRNFLEPKLVGQQIGLHPLATLISMFVGARLFGIVGLFGFPVILSLGIRMKKLKSGADT